MSQSILLPILLIAIGGVNLFFAVSFLKSPNFAKKYIETSPKAWIWRKLFGVEKAIKITKTVFVPIGIILGSGLVLAGIVFFAMQL